ncbi:putative lipid II flippase FtsW [Candidatus Daviesbacteria bacterium]|nr:putative lipid II flippase FtsW [Candidatus Daviesbacteria bacterium]
MKSAKVKIYSKKSSAYLKESSAYSKKNYKIFKHFSGLDYSIVVPLFLLVGFGLIMVYDASVVQAYKDFGDKYYYIKQQLLWALLGFSGLVFCSIFPYQNYKKVALPLFIFSFLLLILVLIPGLGIAAGGAHRWLKLGPITVQPAEIIKLSMIVFLAALFEKRVRTVPFILSLIAVSLILGVFQRDLGSTIVFFVIALAIYVASGASLMYFLFLAPFALAGLVYFILSSHYRRQRVIAFLDPFYDPQGYSYHISQILIALGSGSLFGLGLGQSRQKFEYIPEVTTDSIFAIVGEEFGFLGALVLILIFCYLIYRAFKISENIEDRFGKLLAFGLTCWLGVQLAINLAAMVSLIPLTGVPLPFISYGGSALLTNLVAVGILLNISRSSKA